MNTPIYRIAAGLGVEIKPVERSADADQLRAAAAAARAEAEAIGLVADAADDRGDCPYGDAIYDRYHALRRWARLVERAATLNHSRSTIPTRP